METSSLGQTLHPFKLRGFVGGAMVSVNHPPKWLAGGQLDNWRVLVDPATLLWRSDQGARVP